MVLVVVMVAVVEVISHQRRVHHLIRIRYVHAHVCVLVCVRVRECKTLRYGHGDTNVRAALVGCVYYLCRV